MRRMFQRIRWRLPIRWRLALTSALLTFVILFLFAVVIGAFTAGRLRSDFDNRLRADAVDLAQRFPVSKHFGEPAFRRDDVIRLVLDVAASSDAAIRVLDSNFEIEAVSPEGVDLGPGPPGTVRDSGGYRVLTQPLFADAGSFTPDAFIQYGRQQEALTATITRVNLFLALGTLVGTALALLAGLTVARRAMGPISDLTRAAQEVARTQNPDVKLPRPRAEDEVADLSRTLEGMLRALDAAQLETEATLQREREFVADASHELRTPVTSVLANLEVLEAQLAGEDAEIASSALRSTQRMRRLVADLLFLARADVGRRSLHRPIDLGRVVQGAAAESAPLSAEHELRIEAPTGIVVSGAEDDLHRLVVNLIQNAFSHTPAGTLVRVRLRRKSGVTALGNGGARQEAVALLEVSDDGPGVPESVRERIFERFVRGSGDRPVAGASGSGLGLAIVQAVAQSHGGSVKLSDSPEGGAKFVVRLPVLAIRTEAGATERRPRVDGAQATDRVVPQTSTTTGRTRGRRLRRS